MPQTVVTPDPQLATVRAESSPSAPAFDPAATAAAELDRQIQVYVDVGFPELFGIDAAELRARLAPLQDVAGQLRPSPDVPADDHVTFVVVLDPAAGAINDRVPAMRRGTRQGMSVIDEDEARSYRTIDAVTVPGGFAYLVADVDVGSTLVNVPPEGALRTITERGRTPLTIIEGLALVTVRPDMLRPNRCFSLAGSRTGTDQRVPAVWISERRPKLGWCWDRNPHTWLGTASAGARFSAP